jgi:hypothetical protein
MQLVNETFLQSHMARAQLAYKDLLQAIVVVKGSFDVLATGETRPSALQPEVLTDDTETEHGRLDAELVPVKAWCDLAVLGRAHNPAPASPAPRMTVSLRIGAFERRVRVCGDRVWTKALGRLQPSDPARFASLPLSYGLAYGGFARDAEVDVDVIHHDNPAGKGYVLAKEHVEGTPLPNIEEDDQPIEAWTDRPMTAGLGPLARQTMWRGQRGYELDAEQVLRISPAAFCFAHPRMTLPEYPEGAEVELTGVRRDGAPWRFRLPPLRAWARVELGASRYQMPIAADTVYFLPDEERVVVVGRRTFVYQFLPERRRVTRVMSAPDTTAYGATTSIRELRAAPRDDVPVAVEKPTLFEMPLDEMIRRHPMTPLTEGFPLCPSG